MMRITINPAVVRAMNPAAPPTETPASITVEREADQMRCVSVCLTATTSTTITLTYDPQATPSLMFSVAAGITLRELTGEQGYTLLEQYERTERCWYIHTNVHRIRTDKKHGTASDVIAIRRSRHDSHPHYAARVSMQLHPDQSVFILACPARKMRCGAKVFALAPQQIEVRYESRPPVS